LCQPFGHILARLPDSPQPPGFAIAYVPGEV